LNQRRAGNASGHNNSVTFPLVDSFILCAKTDELHELPDMIIGTRGSELARTQTGHIVSQLESALGMRLDVRIIQTQGDRVTDRPLRELEGRGYFTKELEEALLAGRIDVAVHSFKDMPSKSPDGLVVAAVSRREDPADLLIIRRDRHDAARGPIAVCECAVIGTSAVRREAQLRALRPDITTKDLRGNVPTRVEKVRGGQYDAILLAAAGINRLGLDLTEFVVIKLDPGEFVPAPGQGALAVQMRAGASQLAAVRSAIHDEVTAAGTSLERAVQALFGGGCGLPLGAHARRVGAEWRLDGFWAEAERTIRTHVEGTDPTVLATELYAHLTNRQPCDRAC
jgi:hydroxymethylbilane synthase